MSNLSLKTPPPGPKAAVGLPILKLLWVLCVMAVALAARPALAEDPDDVYVDIYATVQQADALRASSKIPAAIAKYKEADAKLRSFQQNYPTWNPKVVSTRLTELTDAIISLTENPVPPPNNTPAGTGPASPAAVASNAGTASGTAAGTQVKLLEAGAEPRQPLRLHPKPGAKQSVAMILTMAMKMGGTEGMKMPPITLNMSATTKEVTPDGDITYELAAGLPGVKGLKGNVKMSATGLNKGSELKTPAGENAMNLQVLNQLKDNFDQMETPLPEEPVGPGAKWQVTEHISAQGIKMEQTHQMELVSVEGDILTIKDTQTQSANNQKLTVPGQGTLNLTKLTGKGTGSIKIDLTQPLPVGGSSDVAITMTVTLPGQKQAMTMGQDVNVRFESK